MDFRLVCIFFILYRYCGCLFVNTYEYTKSCTFRHLGQIISLAARAYLTNCCNHVKVNFPVRMSKFIQHHLEQIPSIKRHVKTSKLADVIYATLVTGAETFDCTLANYRRFLKNKEGVNPLTDDDVDAVAILYISFYNFVGDVDLSEEALGHANKWHLYLPLLHGILLTFEQHHRQSRLKLRLFNLVPQFTYRHRYLPINTDALFDILRLASHRLVDRTNKTVFGANAREKWGQIFHVAKYGDRFRCYLETDIVAVSILVEKTFSPRHTKADWDVVDITGKRVIGLDPGRRALFTACDRGESVTTCSTKEYRSMAGFIRNQRKVKRWLRLAPHI